MFLPQDIANINENRFHVVQLESDINKLNNSAVGTGKVSLRSDDPREITKLKGRLKQLGISLIPKETPSVNIKNRYSEMTNVKWNDPKLELEEHRLSVIIILVNFLSTLKIIEWTVYKCKRCTKKRLAIIARRSLWE